MTEEEMKIALKQAQAVINILVKRVEADLTGCRLSADALDAHDTANENAVNLAADWLDRYADALAEPLVGAELWQLAISAK